MLNCCIERKRARDEGRKASGTEVARERKTSRCDEGQQGAEGAAAGVGLSQGKSWDSWSDSEDEFFECLSDTEELKEAGPDGERGGGTKPEGRLHPHGEMTLLRSPEPLYIPVTQVCLLVPPPTITVRVQRDDVSWGECPSPSM